MFYTAVLDVGQSGKRYGMAQCTRDLSKSDCGKCLDFQLATYLNIVGNKRNWDIHGSSCSMWYYDYQFYFNYSTPAAKGGSTRSSPHRVAIGMAFPVLVFLEEKTSRVARQHGGQREERNHRERSVREQRSKETRVKTEKAWIQPTSSTGPFVQSRGTRKQERSFTLHQTSEKN
uniref:Gnk2-homologous domain-containing protein n=1 Tax=Populus alba TaxID=43335 RepID=A0A4U5PTP3_POPAL|nr:hypothetical protein D5086_0000194030 [Populus alba]